MPRNEPESDDSDGYDPEQPIAQRREIQRGMRSLINTTNEYQDDFLEAKPHMFDKILLESDSLLKQAKQTSEAAIDARLMLQISELSYKRSLRWTSGNLGNGVDVDEFVSKCITYMRHGGGIEDDNAVELSSTQRQRRVTSNRGAIGGDDDDEEVGDEGDMLNWAHLGRFACVPHISRPAVPGFLLGPLSVEKKTRKITKRTAPLKIRDLKEVRPEVLRTEDLAKAEKNDLAAICNKILNRLMKVQSVAQDTVTSELEALGDKHTEEDSRKLMEKHALRSTGGIDLLRFVVNPRSFGQTIENMFYVSFLIRDGKIGIEYDDDDLPALYPLDAADEAAPGQRAGAMKHQAVMSMDMATWRDIIKAFNIKEPMIEHRKEQTNGGPGAKGWYS